jgi:hypothetical protein
MAVTIDINANPKGFESGLDAMRAKVGSFSTAINGMGAKIAAGFTVGKIVEKSLGALQENAEAYKEMNAEIARGTALLGAQVEEFQKVAFAAKAVRLNGGEMEKSLLKLNTDAAKAGNGDADAKEIFSSIGLDAEKFAAADYAEKVLMLADAFAELSRKGSAVEPMLKALGSDNRSMIQFLEQGRAAIQKKMDTPGIAISAADHEEYEKEREEKQTSSQKALADPVNKKIIKANNKVGKIWDGVRKGFAHTINWLIPDDTPEEIQKEKEEKEADERSQNRLIHRPSDWKSGAGAGANGKKRLTTPIPKLFGTESQRAAMAERSHEMDFRNSQLLETDPKVKMNNLLGERQRILDRAAKEPDKAKAFDLSMKAKGMEPEIMGHAKESLAPDMLTVKAGHIAEMGGGGPVATFGGAEVKIGEGNNLLREIRDALLGKGGGGSWSPGNIPNGEGPVQEPGFYPTSRPMSVENFPKER